MSHHNPLVLAVDIGTSSARATVFDASGTAVPGLRAQAAYHLRTEPTGAAELDANTVVTEVSGCIDTVLKAAGARSGEVAAVGCATLWHSMVGVDSSGKPETPLYTWADTRPAGVAGRLRERLNQDQVHARTGCALHPSYYPARMLWLREKEPDQFKRTHRWLSPGEYLYTTLFGHAECSISMASATGLFDQHRCDWDGEMLEAAGIEASSLAPLTDLTSPATGLLPDAASRWPSLAKIPWVSAIGDGASGNLGSGCATGKRIAINLGTSGAIRVLWPATELTIPGELWCYRLDRQRPIMGAAFSDGGDAYAWAARVLTIGNSDKAEADLAAREPDAHGLTFLPFLSGERSTGWRPSARATLHGLSVATTPLDILQAVMEGVALRFALAAETLFRQFPEADEIVASGGAIAHSPAWARMIADAIGRPITLSPESEATSRGAAICALAALGLEPPLPGSDGHQASVIDPTPGRHTLMRRALARQQDLYSRLI